MLQEISCNFSCIFIWTNKLTLGMGKTKIQPSVYTNNFRALKKISILNLQYSGLETKEREREGYFDFKSKKLPNYFITMLYSVRNNCLASRSSPLWFLLQCGPPQTSYLFIFKCLKKFFTDFYILSTEKCVTSGHNFTLACEVPLQ